MSSPPSSPLSPTRPDSDYNSNLGHHLLASDVRAFRKLHELRLRGWSDETLNDHFARQRASADTAGHELSLIWFNRMKDVLREVDKGTYCIEWTGPLQFLDLGCCPGGFTSYILDTNSAANGVGISLDVDSGGHAYALEERLRARFTLHHADMLHFNLGTEPCDELATNRDGESLSPPPFSEFSRPFGLVLLDGHYLRSYKAAHSETPWDRDRLLVSQMIIALQAVEIGGTLVVKMSHAEVVPTAKLIYMLDVLSQNVRCWKPESMHATRGTFYVVAKGVGLGEYGSHLDHCVSGLREVWQALYSGGGEGMGRYLSDADLDFVVTNDELTDTYLPRLVKLCNPVWWRQANALERWFTRRNVGHNF